jgi:predicted DNA-binding protein (MmcQ/YjbR family)
MHIDEIREYCLSKPGVADSFPFDQSALVFKVMGKMFLICNVDNYTGFTAKCDPEWAVELRERYPDGVLPGYHTSKTHWNTVMAFSNVPDVLQAKMIDHSYELVVAGLTKKLKAELEELSQRDQ